ncbi:unnamed protein product, partial [Tetraodon nigroviridis]
LQDNLFEWHFSVRGPQTRSLTGGSTTAGSCSPQSTPMKPPIIILLI